MSDTKRPLFVSAEDLRLYECGLYSVFMVGVETPNRVIPLVPTQGADAPLGWVWERCYSNGGYTRRFCALESEARELATDGEALSHPDRVYPFFAKAQGADTRPIYQMRSDGEFWHDIGKCRFDVLPKDIRRIVYATRDDTPTVDARPALTDEQVEKGWHATFSTGNPYCPCNLTSFTKAVRWAERTIMGGTKS